MSVSTGMTLLRTSGANSPPTVTLTTNTFNTYNEYVYPQNSIADSINVGYQVNNGIASSIGIERLSGFPFSATSITTTNIAMTSDLRTGSFNQTTSSSYRIAATVDGVVYYSPTFNINSVFWYKPTIYVDNLTQSTSCSYTGPATTCGSLLKLSYAFTGYRVAGGSSAVAISSVTIEYVSGASFSVTAGSTGNFIYLNSTSSGTISGVCRIKIVELSTSITYYSSNINWTLVASSTGFTTPSISTSGAVTGTCNYVYPDTSCTSTGVRNFTISSYTVGVPFAELVSGTTLVASFSGSNSSGSFTFTKASTTTSSPTTSVYRIGITVGGTNYYSSNFNMDMSATKTSYNLGTGLVYSKDCEDSATTPSIVTQANTTTTYPAGLISNCAHHTYPNISAGTNFFYRNTFATTAGVPFTFSIWFKCSQPSPASPPNNGRIRLLKANLYYNSTDVGLTVNNFYNYLTGWNNICCWYDGASLFTSLNNGTSFSSSANSTLASVSVGGSYNLTLSDYIGFQGTGNDSSSNVFMDIDSVFIWSRALNQSERNALYNSGAGRASSALAGLVG